MIYQAEITVPPQTPKGAALKEELFLPKGTITRVSILFPAGCAALAHVIILHNERQVWPTSAGRSFVGDYMYMDFRESYELPDAWNRIQVVAWNEDDSYPHTIVVWLECQPYEETWTLPGVWGMPRSIEGD